MIKLRNGRELKWEDVEVLERSLMSDAQIAYYYGLSRMGFLKLRRRYGVSRKNDEYLRSDAGVERVSGEKKRESRNKYMRKYMREHPECSYSNMRRQGKIVAEHRHIANDMFVRVFGRKLKRNEVVHHIDGDRTNNEKSNLLICDHKFHKYLHDAGKIRRVSTV